MASNPIFHASTKHVEIDYHFIKEKVLNKQITVQHVGTLGQIADIFTKALSEARFHFLRSKLMVVLTLQGCKTESLILFWS